MLTVTRVSIPITQDSLTIPQMDALSGEYPAIEFSADIATPPDSFSRRSSISNRAMHLKAPFSPDATPSWVMHLLSVLDPSMRLYMLGGAFESSRLLLSDSVVRSRLAAHHTVIEAAPHTIDAAYRIAGNADNISIIVRAGALSDCIPSIRGGVRLGIMGVTPDNIAGSMAQLERVSPWRGGYTFIRADHDWIHAEGEHKVLDRVWAFMGAAEEFMATPESNRMGWAV